MNIPTNIRKDVVSRIVNMVIIFIKISNFKYKYIGWRLVYNVFTITDKQILIKTHMINLESKQSS